MEGLELTLQAMKTLLQIAADNVSSPVAQANLWASERSKELHKDLLCSLVEIVMEAEGLFLLPSVPF